CCSWRALPSHSQRWGFSFSKSAAPQRCLIPQENSFRMALTDSSGIPCTSAASRCCSDWVFTSPPSRWLCSHCLHSYLFTPSWFSQKSPACGRDLGRSTTTIAKAYRAGFPALSIGILQRNVRDQLLHGGQIRHFGSFHGHGCGARGHGHAESSAERKALDGGVSHG